MANPHRRAGTARITGRRRSSYLAQRIGIGLRESRIAVRLTQAQASDRAGVSQPFWSRLERGGAGTASIETLAACAAAVGAQLAAFLEAVPGADLPRDMEHLRRQQLVIAIARGGGWIALRAQRRLTWTGVRQGRWGVPDGRSSRRRAQSR